MVALYFACCDVEKESENVSDGEVICFKNNELDIASYPIYNGIAESYKFTKASMCELDFFYDIIEQSYFLEQKRLFKNHDNQYGAEWVEDCIKRTDIYICTSKKYASASTRWKIYIIS